MRRFNPGDIAPCSCQYRLVNASGKTLDVISCEEGNRLPPTQSSEYFYELDD